MKGDRTIHPRVLDYAYTGTDILYKEFHISQKGYSDEQVEASRGQYGKNILSGRASDTVLYRLRRAFINPFSIILFVLAAISLVTDVFLASNFSRNFTTVTLIVSMLLISGVVRFTQELRAKRVADHLTQMIASNVLVLRNGQWVRLPSTQLVVGDTVRLVAGDRVPADLRLTDVKDLFVSQSVLTGESTILEKHAKTLPQGKAHSYAEYSNLAFMGSSVIGGTGEGVVLAVGPDTVYGGFSSSGANRNNRFDQGANSIARVLIHFMVALVPVVFIACGATKGNWLSAFLFALSVAVGLTPELLPMVINACLAKGSSAMGKKQTVVKNINAMQGFGSMDVLCVDKTGTLTGDRIALEYYMDVLGNESQQVLDFAYLNSLYHTGVRNHLDDAILTCRNMPGHGDHFQALEEEFIAKPRKWDASSVGNFMLWIGPTSSIFDFTTYLFMYFVFCPMFISGGVLFNDLPAHFSGAELALMQAKYIGLFQAGWFVESMWSQTLVIHMIRTPKLPFLQSRASAPLTLLTLTGITVLTVIPFAPLGAALGFVALPAAYFAYLIPCILLYMILATSLKKAYVRHYGELL